MEWYWVCSFYWILPLIKLKHFHSKNNMIPIWRKRGFRKLKRTRFLLGRYSRTLRNKSWIVAQESYPRSFLYLKEVNWYEQLYSTFRLYPDKTFMVTHIMFSLVLTLSIEASNYLQIGQVGQWPHCIKTSIKSYLILLYFSGYHSSFSLEGNDLHYWQNFEAHKHIRDDLRILWSWSPWEK